MAYQQSYQPPPQKRSSVIWWIIGGCGVILVLVALCACGFFVLGGAALLSVERPSRAPAVVEVATVQPPRVPSEPTDTLQPPSLSPDTPIPTDTPQPLPSSTETPLPADTRQPPPPPTEAPTLTPSPPQLEILSHQSYVDGEWFHIVGEVQNNSHTPMEFVKIVATLYDDAGQVVGTDFAYTEIDAIPSDGKSPFETGTDEWAGTTNYKLQVEGNAGTLPRQDIAILSHSHYIDGDWLHVRGEVQNTGDTPAEFVKIVVTLYDAAGNVVGTDFTYTDLNVVPAGGTSPFETGTDHWPNFDHYEIQVQAQ